MRQAKREITEISEIVAILDRCDTCRLGLADDGQPYIVPMNFGYEMSGERLTLYFHCATAGRKLEIIGRNPRACFEMDCSHQLRTGEQACQYSMNFESIIGSGRIEIVPDAQGRENGLNSLMNQYSGRANWSFDPAALAKTVVLRLTADEYCGKRLNK